MINGLVNYCACVEAMSHSSCFLLSFTYVLHLHPIFLRYECFRVSHVLCLTMFCLSIFIGNCWWSVLSCHLTLYIFVCLMICMTFEQWITYSNYLLKRLMETFAVQMNWTRSITKAKTMTTKSHELERDLSVCRTSKRKSNQYRKPALSLYSNPRIRTYQWHACFSFRSRLYRTMLLWAQEL